MRSSPDLPHGKSEEAPDYALTLSAETQLEV